MSLPPLVAPPLVARRVRVAPTDVVYLKAIIEASSGLAVVIGQAAGELLIATTPEQVEALDELLRDLQEEIGALVES